MGAYPSHECTLNASARFDPPRPDYDFAKTTQEQYTVPDEEVSPPLRERLLLCHL